MIQTLMDALGDLFVTGKESSPEIKIWKSGSAWPTTFSQVNDVSNGGTPAANQINFYRTPYEQGSVDRRPAVYFGSKNLDYQDELEYETCNGAHIEYRKLTIPIIIVASDTLRLNAQKKRDQIRQNIRYLMRYYTRHAGWYDVSFPGGQSNPDKGSTSSSGGDSNINQSESIGTLYICLHYMYNPLDQLA